MTEQTEPRSQLSYGWTPGESGWGDPMNANLLRIGRFGFHPSVKSRALTAPPGSPVNGDAYIPAAGATGAWAGHAGEVAVYDGGWIFAAPRAGWVVRVDDEGGLVCHDGAAWSADALRADRLATAWTHSQATGNAHSATPAQIGALPINNPTFTGTMQGPYLRISSLASGLNGVPVSDFVGTLSVKTADQFRAYASCAYSGDIGKPSGIASLDATGSVPSGQLPSYVDDVVEVANFAALPGTGEAGKIYITLDDNKTWRWSGSGYAEISASLALGETSSTAYRGDRGKIAYNHSQVTGNPHGTTPSDIGAAPLAGAEVLIHSDFGRSATTDVWQSAFTDNTAAGLQLAANSTASGTEITIEQAVVIPADASGATYQFYIGPQLTGEGAPSGSTYAIVLDPNEAGGYGRGIVRIKCELIGSGSSITGYVTSTFSNNSGYPPTVKVGTITVNGTIANSIDVRFNPQSVTGYVIRRNRVRRCNP